MFAAVRPYAEILEALRSPYAVDDLLSEGEPPVLLTDITGQTVTGDVGETLRSFPAVTVAICDEPSATNGEGVAAFDVPLADDPGSARAPVTRGISWTTPDAGVTTAIDRIIERARSNPQASVGVVQLLRLSSNLGVVDGLVAESLMYSTLQSGSELKRWITSRDAPSTVQLEPEPLLIERSGPELRIALNRPEIRNAFGFEVRDALVEALQLAAFDDEVHSIVISGRGPAFCSGGDLREFGTLPDPSTAHLVRTTRNAGYWIHRVADRVRVEIHGTCIGAGIELPAFAGHVAAAANTTIALPEVGMGLVPGAGGTVSIPRRIGRHRTAYLALTGEQLPASTALEWGLVDEIR